jgi:hypothetical protein
MHSVRIGVSLLAVTLGLAACGKGDDKQSKQEGGAPQQTAATPAAMPEGAKSAPGTAWFLKGGQGGTQGGDWLPLAAVAAFTPPPGCKGDFQGSLRLIRQRDDDGGRMVGLLRSGEPLLLEQRGPGEARLTVTLKDIELGTVAAYTVGPDNHVEDSAIVNLANMNWEKTPCTPPGD